MEELIKAVEAAIQSEVYSIKYHEEKLISDTKNHHEALEKAKEKKLRLENQLASLNEMLANETAVKK